MGESEIEFYPMPSFPSLMVGDPRASAAWYQRVLGFQLVFEMPGPGDAPILVHLRWAKYADLLLLPERAQSPVEKGVGVTLNYAMGSGSVDDLAARIRSEGVSILTGPVDQPWNARELTLPDPDGYRLTFTQVIDRNRSFDAVIENVQHQSD